MHKFVSRILVYIFTVALVFIALTGVYYLMLSTISFTLPEDKNILVVGDSHTESAIDDDIYYHAINVSRGATPYLYSYHKLRKFLDENSHIDTVLLSFHNFALPSRILTQFDEAHMKENIPNYLPLFDWETINLFLSKKGGTFMFSILNISTDVLLKFIRDRIYYGDSYAHSYAHIGGYWRLERDKLQEDIRRHEQNAKEATFSWPREEYLLKIVELCESKKVTLVLINTPTYSPEMYGDIDNVNDYYRTYLSGVRYVDYSAFQLPDSCYGDIGHLNYKGARLFSQYLRDHFSADVESAFSKHALAPPPSVQAKGD